MRRAGFTLIEILIVVGIIVIMLASSVVSVASGRGAVKAKEATRGVVQLSRYASALALLRQRPVVVTYHHGGRIEVRISGESTGGDGASAPADPIYREVDGQETLPAAGRSEAEEKDAAASGAPAKAAKAEDERRGFFYTRRVLDPEALAREDADGQYEGVTFTVEVLGEDGEPLAPEAAALRTLKQPQRVRKPDADADGLEEGEEDQTPPVSVTYETNGNVNPYRVIVRLDGEDESSEGFAISISRSGKATVGDAEEERGRRGGRVRRRGR